MKAKILYLALWSFATGVWISPTASAAVIHQPVGVSTDMATQGGAIGNTINQSGLSTGYTNGVTDLASYLTGSPTHDSLNPSNYFSGLGSTGNIDFDLGGSYLIESFILWTDPAISPASIRNFTLLASDDVNFTNPLVLGNFAATGPGSYTAVAAELFSFSSTQAQYVRLQITSNNGGSATVLGEAAFGQASQAQIPEPGTFLLGASGLLLAMAVKKRHR